ncbi:mitochondrial thiamine pyrophosphate carrier-like isoform X1 [Microplitis mediator]|uniref:mitochondrial thiamine pyrophosphate carrier-like isoform X1 n=2 Tax=Microplitis mediator TaxID=375433 RepID=UPI002557412B|nr:mitochondrial thiamine pyrophosphate carrier-like isoform X1 [Microplitis mediator]
MKTGIKMDSNKNHAVAGAISGFMTRLICQPLDVIKIRFQLQVEPISRRHVSKYQSLFQATSTIIHEEGLLALWKGHVPAQFLSITYGMAQFYSYHKLMELMTNTRISNWQFSMNFIAGATAGSIATIASFPFDIARTRLVAQSSNHKIYTGLFNCYATILKTESVRTLFRGLSLTLLQIAPHTGLQFLFYNISKKLYKRLKPDTDITATNSLVSGSIAGLLSKTAIYPMDLARKRLQIQGFEHGRVGFGKFFQCGGLIDCFVRIVKEEGVLGLFKGLLPSQVKATATSSLHFTFYEQALQLLRFVH